MRSKFNAIIKKLYALKNFSRYHSVSLFSVIGIIAIDCSIYLHVGPTDGHSMERGHDAVLYSQWGGLPAITILILFSLAVLSWILCIVFECNNKVYIYE